MGNFTRNEKVRKRNDPLALHEHALFTINWKVFFVEVPKNVFEGEALAGMVIKVRHSLSPSKCYQTTFTGIVCSWLGYVKDF